MDKSEILLYVDYGKVNNVLHDIEILISTVKETVKQEKSKMSHFRKSEKAIIEWVLFDNAAT